MREFEQERVVVIVRFVLVLQEVEELPRQLQEIRCLRNVVLHKQSDESIPPVGAGNLANDRKHATQKVAQVVEK